LGRFFENKKVAFILGYVLFTCGVGYALMLTKNGLGYIMGDFFTNSSVHPGHGGAA
jgi:uncharacterized membrane protein SpoIIM required for sporulation